MSDHYTYHVAIYSKLISGYDPMGPIKRGSEARVNGMTAGFPPELFPHCIPSNYFAGAPLITDIDPEIINGGAFVYAPIKVSGTHYSVFARMQARSEEGEGEPGRKYTHCALIFVQDKWEPGLIQWAAEMLFTTRHENRCWGSPVAEFDEERENLPVPPLKTGIRVNLPDGGALAGTDEAQPPLTLRGRLQTAVDGIDLDVHPYVLLGAQLGETFYSYDYSVSGRWLSIGLGIGSGVKGAGKKDFFARLDMRDQDGLAEVKLPDWDDFNAAKIFVPISSAGQSPMIDWAELHGPDRAGDRYEFLLSDDMLSDLQLKHIYESRMQDTLVPQAAETGSGLAEAANSFQHGQPANAQGSGMSFALCDPMHWPELHIPAPEYLSEESDADYDDTAYDRVFDPYRIGLIRPALHQIVMRCQILDSDSGYGRLDLSPDYDRLKEGVRTLVEFTCSYMVLANPDNLREVMEDLLTHPPIESLGLPHASRGGLLQQLFTEVIEHIGRERIARWMDDKYRYESRRAPDLRRKGLLVGSYTVHKTERRQVAAFFDWLEDAGMHVPSDACDLNALLGLARDVADDIAHRWGLDYDVEA